MDERGCIRDAGDAWKAIFPGDDGAMDQHPTPPFHDPSREWDHEGHSGIHSITHEYFPSVEVKHIGWISDYPCFSPRDTWPRRLTDDLPRLYPIVGLRLVC